MTFEQLVATYTTLSWKPNRSLALVSDNSVAIVGDFIEDRQVRNDGAKERVFGRLVEIWSETEDGKWVLNLR